MSRCDIPAEPFAISVDFARTALVIIDMQRDFLEPGGFGAALGNDVSLLAAAIAPCRAMLAGARAAGMLVIHTREGHRPDLSDAPRAKVLRGDPATCIGAAGPMGRILIRGEAGHDIVPALRPLPAEPVIDKPGKGAFYQTDLDLMLRNRGIETLLVSGVTTEVCVHTTRVLTADGVVSLIGCLMGNPFINAVYIGHPGWKAMGGRIGYSAATGLIVVILCWFGVIALMLPSPTSRPNGHWRRRGRSTSGGRPGRS